MTFHYVDQSNKTHVLDDRNFEHLLPPGCSLISDEQYAAIKAAEVPAFDLAAYQVDAQAQIDAHYETLYKTSVVNSAIAAEYQAAYESATKWLADTAEPAPERVKALAESYGVTNLQAAGVVKAKWEEAQLVAFDLRGAARLRAKLAVRTAVDKSGVDAAVADGKTAMEEVVFSV